VRDKQHWRWRRCKSCERKIIKVSCLDKEEALFRLCSISIGVLPLLTLQNEAAAGSRPDSPPLALILQSLWATLSLQPFIFSSPYVQGFIFSSPHVQGFIFSAPYVQGFIFSSPYVQGFIFSSPYVRASFSLLLMYRASFFPSYPEFRLLHRVECILISA
jgi:hypothetical protein